LTQGNQSDILELLKLGGNKMKKIFYLLFVILSTFIITSLATVKTTFSNEAAAQNTTPEEYTIKKGDTLWDISKNKLQDNFLWPKLWNSNPQIKNPDAIYPGQKIRIPSREELMSMPETIIEQAPLEATPEITEDSLMGMPKQYIVSKELLISSGWIASDYPSIGKIFAAPTSQTIHGTNDPVYLKTDKTAAAGDKFFAIRKIKKVKHPRTGKSLGYQIRVTGILEVVGMDGKDKNVPKAKILTAFEDLQNGDGLMPYREIEAPVVPGVVRAPNIRGYIVESYMNTIMVGQGDIVYLDKGENDGLKIGDVFSVFSEVPVERTIGKSQVISLQPKTSVALILKNDEDISVGDTWGKK
jgi:LysM repeat protein